MSSYRDVSLAWAGAAALILPLGLIPLGFEAAWIPGLGSGWEASHLAAREVSTGQALGAYAIIQAVVFLAVYLITRLPTITRWVTPRAVRRARARNAAMQQFLAHGLHVTEGRTGVLIFVPYFHRDDARLPFADRFSPDVWLGDGGRVAGEWPLIPFSGGPAECPGRQVVLLLASHLLSAMIGGGEWRLVPPPWLDPAGALPGTLDHFGLRFAQG